MKSRNITSNLNTVYIFVIKSEKKNGEKYCEIGEIDQKESIFEIFAFTEKMLRIGELLFFCKIVIGIYYVK